MIPQNKARQFAHQTGSDLHIAQQDVVLLYALDALDDADTLGDLIFKGGTYLRKMLLGNDGRFSEDLDFTNHGLEQDPEAAVGAAFEGPHHGVAFDIVDPYETDQGNWACTVTYQHDWADGQFKLEISSREQAFLDPEPKEPIDQIYFGALPFEPPVVPCMRREEAIAEKLRAVQQRTTERDLYDVIQYARKGFDEDLVRLLAVGKLWNDRQKFDPDEILGTLEEGRRNWPDLRNLVGDNRQGNWNARCRKAAKRFAFLRDLTDFERRLIEDHRHHTLQHELDQHLDAYR